MPDLSLSLSAMTGALQQVVLGTASPGAGVIEVRITSGASHHAILKGLETMIDKVRAETLAAP